MPSNRGAQILNRSLLPSIVILAVISVAGCGAASTAAAPVTVTGAPTTLSITVTATPGPPVVTTVTTTKAAPAPVTVTVRPAAVTKTADPVTVTKTAAADTSSLDVCRKALKQATSMLQELSGLISDENSAIGRVLSNLGSGGDTSADLAIIQGVGPKVQDMTDNEVPQFQADYAACGPS